MRSVIGAVIFAAFALGYLLGVLGKAEKGKGNRTRYRG